MKKKHKIIIVGGGFAGISTALSLSKTHRDTCDILLISDKPHFEYHAALYRVVAGHPADEVAIPLQTIFDHTAVRIKHNSLTSIDPQKNTITCNNNAYPYDYLVLALGSEPSYHNRPREKTNVLTLHSIKDAFILNAHIDHMIKTAIDDCDEAAEDAHFAIIGGGAAGVELAGELALYTQKLCKKYSLNPSYITIDLIEKKHRVLSHFPPHYSTMIQQRLRSLGVHVFLNQTVKKNTSGELILGKKDIHSKTIIWTAGTTAHHFYTDSPFFTLNTKKRVRVTPNLRALGHNNIYIGGDAAETLFGGYAETAIQQGAYIAQHISSDIHKYSCRSYIDRPPISAIPVGRGWAAASINGIYYFGLSGWLLRRWIDLNYFRSILPLKLALKAFSKTSIFEDNDPLFGD